MALGAVPGTWTMNMNIDVACKILGRELRGASESMSMSSCRKIRVSMKLMCATRKIDCQ
jgi:hypothetical protein